MDTFNKEEILSQMVQIGEMVDTQIDRATQSRESIDFFDDLTVGNSGLAEQNVYVVKIANQNEKDPSYEIYDKNNNKILTHVG